MTDEKKGGNGAVVAGVAAAVIGAAAGAAAVALSDKKNREKVGKVAGEIKATGEKLFKDIQESDVVKDITKRVSGKGSPAKQVKAAK